MIGYVSAQECRTHFLKGKRVRYHPNAPYGISSCPICKRIVVRGLGRWWEA